MQVIFPYLYKFVMKATRFGTLSHVLTPLFYPKGYNNLYFYKLSLLQVSFFSSSNFLSKSTIVLFLRNFKITLTLILSFLFILILS